MTDLEATLASLQRAQMHSQAKTKNSNTEADANPQHDITKNTVTKSHALSRAYYRFGIVEKRVMEALISKLHPMRTDNQLQDIELRASEYLKAFPDVGNHAYEHIASAIDAIVERIIVVHESSNKVRKITLAAQAVYEKNEGKITVTFNPLIVPHLIGLRDKFSSYPLKKAVDFSSSYTWRFYELLVSWAQPKQDTKGIFAGWIKHQSVEELRKILGVPDSYRWSIFQAQVLDVVTKELKEKSNIVVFIERVKTSRKITHLNIKFIEDNQFNMPLEGGVIPKKSRKKAA